MNLFIRLSILAVLASTSIGCGGYVAYAPRPIYAPAPMYAPAYYPSRPIIVRQGPFVTYPRPIYRQGPLVRYGAPAYRTPTSYRTAPMGAYGRPAPRTFYQQRRFGR